MIKQLRRGIASKLNAKKLLSYEVHMQGKAWVLGLVFFTIKLFYSATYLGLKYNKIDPKEQNVNNLMRSVDNLYLGLLIGNLIILLVLSIGSKFKHTICLALQFWALLGLFLESFQCHVYFKRVAPYDCEEHQLRISSYVPLTYLLTATLSDSVVLIPLLRTGGIILLTYYDMECGVRFTLDNYLVWIVGESVNFWILSIIAVILRRHLFRSLTKVRLEAINLRSVVASIKDPILALK
jgi:hypothetical protein